MKNPHSLLLLFSKKSENFFGEKRNVKLAKNPGMDKFTGHFNKDSKETLRQKEQRLAAIGKMMRDYDKIDDNFSELDVTIPLDNPLTTPGKKKGKNRFTHNTLSAAMWEYAEKLYPSDRKVANMQRLDLLKAFDEKNTVSGVNDNLQKHKGNYDSVRFILTTEGVKIFRVKDGEIPADAKFEKPLGQFDAKSALRKEMETKRHEIIEKIKKERKELQETIKRISDTRKTMMEFTRTEQQRLKKNKYLVHTGDQMAAHAENGLSVGYVLEGNQGRTLVRVDGQYIDGEYVTSIWKTTPKGEALKVADWKSKSKLRLPTHEEIDLALEAVAMDGAQKASGEEPERNYAKKQEKIEKREAKKEEKAIEVKTDLKTKSKNIKEAVIKETENGRILSITTKRGHTFEYKEHRTDSGKAVWEYLGKDTDKKVGEFYLDDGTRVNPDGSAFDASKAAKKNHLKSGLVGKVLDLKRNTGRDFEETVSKETKVETVLSDKARENPEKASAMIAPILKITNESVQDAFADSATGNDVIRAVQRTAPMLRAHKDIEEATFKVHGKELTWTREKGFGTYGSILEIANSNVDKAKVKELKEDGAEITEPKKLETLTVLEYENIKRALKNLTNIIENGTNTYEILDQLKTQVGAKLKKALKESKIKSIEFSYKSDTENKITWEKGGINSGLANETQVKDAIRLLKKKELGENSREYKRFLAVSKTEYINRRREENKTKKLEQYRRDWKEIVGDGRFGGKKYRIDPSIYTRLEGDFAKNWAHIEGRRGSVERVLSKHPFSYSPDQVPGIIHSAIESTGSLDKVRGSRRMMNFNGLFYAVEGNLKKNLAGIVPKEFLAERGKLDYGEDSLLWEIQNLVEKDEKDLTEGEAKFLEVVFEKVMTPLIQILEMMETLTYDETTGQTEKEEEKEELPEDQKRLNEGLKELCNFQESPMSGWSKFMGIIGGREKEITMQTMDGVNFMLNQGMFERHNDPQSAYDVLRNTKGLYDYKSKPKRLKPKPFIAKINRLMRLGYKNLSLQERGNDEHTIIEDYVTLKDFKNFNEQQMMAFQLGYIVDQASKSDAQLQEAKDILIKTDNPTMKIILEELFYKGIPPKDLNTVKTQLAAAGVFVISIENGKVNWANTNIGAGINIPLSDGLSLQIGASATPKGDVDVGIGINFVLKRGEHVVWSMSTGVSTSGLGVGVNATFDMFGLQTTASLGVGVSYTGSFKVGGGIVMEFENMEEKMQKKTKERLDKSEYAKLWEKWKDLPSHQIDKKIAALKEIHPLWEDQLVPWMRENDVTEKEMVFMLDNVKEKLTSEAIEDLSRFFLTHGGLYVGLSVGTEGGFSFGILPVVGINIGGAEIFVPKRKEIARVLPLISDARVRDKLQAMERDLDSFIDGSKDISELKNKYTYIAQTPDMTYDTETGQYITVKPIADLDLGKWRTDPEKYNELLADAEITLKEIDDKKIEIVIENDDDKDSIVINDPGIAGLALVKDGSRYFLVGDYTDLIITRERLTYPRKLRENGPTIKDRIVIRQKESVVAADLRTVEWMEANASHVMEKPMEDDEYTVVDGDPFASGNWNVMEVAGYSTGTEGIEKAYAKDKKTAEMYKTVTEWFEEHAPKKGEQLDKKTIKEMEEMFKRGDKIMGNKYEEDLEKETLRKDLYKSADKLYEDKSFKKEFTKAESMNDPTALAATVIKYSKKDKFKKTLGNLNTKELATVVSYLDDKWFSQVAKKKELAGEDREKINKELKERIEKRVDWVLENSFKPRFKKAKDRLEKRGIKFTHSIDKMLAQIKADSYGELLKKLDDKNFKFEDLKVVGVPGGANFVSGTRAYDEKGKKVGELAETLYQESPKPEDLVHGFGFLEGTVKNYRLNGKNVPKIEKEIAQLMLESSSPIPENDTEFLKARLTKKVLSTPAFLLLYHGIVNKGASPESSIKDWKSWIDIMEDPSKIKGSHKESFAKLRKFIEHVRTNYQIKGQAVTFKINGLEVAFKMNTETVGGAYTKCANPSFYSREKGLFMVRPGVRSKFVETTELADHEQSKVFVSLLLGGGVSVSKIPTTPPDKQSDEGVAIDQDAEAHETAGTGGNVSQSNSTANTVVIKDTATKQFGPSK